MLNNINAYNALRAASRSIEGRVYVYNADGSTAYTFRHDDYLKEFKVERLGNNSKFFGFGVSHKANIKVLDKERKLTLNTSNRIYPYFINRSTGSAESIFTFPYMDITEVHRDENTNELSITCYDRLYKATEHKMEEIAISEPYTLKQVINACGNLLGLSGVLLINIADEAFSLEYDGEENTASIEGSETIKEVLDMAAEITQTIYYIDKNNKLVFRRLDKDGNELLEIRKDDYITLESKTNRRLTSIVSATELGDNIPKATGESGSTQYIRDNAFLDLRADRETLVESALAAMGGFTLNQFECSWRGNYLLEIGDKISLITKDDEKVFSYLLDDVITYTGSLSEETRWSYEDNEDEDENSPSTVGETIKQTFAKVDRANKEITLMASEVSDASGAIAQLMLDTENIKASVSSSEANTQEVIDGINAELETVNKKVEAAMTSEAVELKIQQELESSGAGKVITSTGFVFDETGLTIEKTDSKMKTQITEDGMTVRKGENEDEVLIANSEGVKAEDLHATTYLIIGNNSRFEDYEDAAGNTRTGCFWIGG